VGSVSFASTVSTLALAGTLLIHIFAGYGISLRSGTPPWLFIPAQGCRVNCLSGKKRKIEENDGSHGWTTTEAMKADGTLASDESQIDDERY
jgi:hypothetical protein